MLVLFSVCQWMLYGSKWDFTSSYWNLLHKRRQEQPSTKAPKIDLHSTELQKSTKTTSHTTAHQPTVLQHRRDLSVPATLEAHTATVIQKWTKHTLFTCNFQKDAGSCFNGQNRDYFCLFLVPTSGTSTCASPVGPSSTECQALAALSIEEQDRPSDLHQFSASFPIIQNRNYNTTLPYWE